MHKEIYNINVGEVQHGFKVVILNNWYGYRKPHGY